MISVAAIINNEVVTVNYLFGQVNLTFFMPILGSASSGAMFMGSLGVFRSIHNYMNSQGGARSKKDLQHRVKTLEDELKKQQQNHADAVAKVSYR
jgi:hypothetical protein